MNELQIVQDDYSEITGISLWVYNAVFERRTEKSLTVGFLGNDGKKIIDYVSSYSRGLTKKENISKLSYMNRDFLFGIQPFFVGNELKGYCIGLLDLSETVYSESRFEEKLSFFTNITKSFYTLDSQNANLKYQLYKLKENEKLAEAEKERLQHQNDYDELTKVHSRAYFFKKIEEADKDDSMLPISIVVGDVNNLKFTNDMFGHRHGDELLIKVAQVLQECAQDNYTVARCGGDEFFILMPNTQRAGANYFCKCVNEKLAKENATCLPPSVSLGSAKKSEKSQSLNRLIEVADAKMYAEKSRFKESHNQFDAMLETLFSRKFLTREMVARETKLVEDFASTIGYDPLRIERCVYLVRYQDIGLCIVPERIYKRDGKYSDREWREIKKHPQLGMKIALINTKIAPISEWVHLTHENYDGSGWPRAVKKDGIPEEVTLVRLVTEFVEKEQQTSTEEAYEYIKFQSGRIFEPKMCEKFVDYLDKYVL